MAHEIATDPFEPFARAGARIVRIRAGELVGEATGVLDVNDIERVHDMRVATRRLRAVLEIFAPSWKDGAQDELKDVLRDVKALADALGERRDPDVQIEAMERFADAAPEAARPGVELLVARLRARQGAANETLAEALRTALDHGLHARLHALANTADEAAS